jgi:hypothetical protein
MNEQQQQQGQEQQQQQGVNGRQAGGNDVIVRLQRLTSLQQGTKNNSSNHVFAVVVW